MILFDFLLSTLLLGHIPNILFYLKFGFFPKIYLFDITVFFIFIYSFFLRNFRAKRADTLILLFFIINTIFLILNTKLLFAYNSFFYLVRLLIYLWSYPYFLYVISKYPFKFLKRLLIFSFFLNIFYLLLFYLYPNLYLPFYDPHRGRLYGPLFDPNLYAIIILTTSLFLLEYFFKSRSNRALFVLSLSFLSIYLTYSRIGILSLFLIFIIYLFKTRNYLVVLTILGFIGLIISSPLYLSRFLFVEGHKTSFILRIQSYIEGSLLFNKSIIPFGFNNIKIYKYFLVGATNNSASYTDSLILNLLLTGGVLNIFFLFLLLYFLYTTAKSSQSSVFLIPFLIVMTSLAFNTFFHPYFIIFFIWSYIWSLIPKKES